MDSSSESAKRRILKMPKITKSRKARIWHSIKIDSETYYLLKANHEHFSFTRFYQTARFMIRAADESLHGTENEKGKILP